MTRGINDRRNQSQPSSERMPSEPTQVTFSPELSEYIRTGVDPTGRYSKAESSQEKLSFALVYTFIGVMIVVGLLGAGVGRKLLEDLLRLTQGS